MNTKPYHKGHTRVSEKDEFSKIVKHHSTKRQQLWVLEGAEPSLLGLAATKWVPMGAGGPGMSPNDETNHSPTGQSIFPKKMNFDKFVGPTTHQNNNKTLGVNNQNIGKTGAPSVGSTARAAWLGGQHVGPNVCSNTCNVNK